MQNCKKKNYQKSLMLFVFEEKQQKDSRYDNFENKNLFFYPALTNFLFKKNGKRRHQKESL